MSRAATSRRWVDKRTPEEIEQARQRDRDLAADADKVIADEPEFVAAWTRRVAAGQIRGRVLRYSLRNQMLIARQADDRGLAISDVDTLRGWRERGRRVRKGEKGLRIVAPRGTTSNPDNEADDDGQDSGDEQPAAPLFRMRVVFDRSQTDGPDTEATPADDACVCGAGPDEPCRAGCVCLICDPGGATDEPQEDPAEVLWNSACEQIAQAGYQIVYPGEPAAGLVDVNHEDRLVRITLAATPNSETALVELTAALAQVLTRSRQQRAAARAALPAGSPA